MNRDFGVQGKEAWRRAAKRKGFPAKMKKLGSSWRFFFFFSFLILSLTKLLAILETS